MSNDLNSHRTVYAFACRTHGAPQWGESIYNAHTAGHGYIAREGKE